MQDLKPFLSREGKYRIPANLSQIQYATALRKYKVVDYTKLAKQSEHRKEQEDMKVHSKKNSLSVDPIVEEKSAQDDSHASLERKIRRERNRINKINNGFTSLKNISKVTTEEYNQEIHERSFQNIPSRNRLENRHSSVFLPPISTGALEALKQKSPESIKIL